jgi:hypothetical protein
LDSIYCIQISSGGGGGKERMPIHWSMWILQKPRWICLHLHRQYGIKVQIYFARGLLLSVEKKTGSWVLNAQWLNLWAPLTVLGSTILGSSSQLKSHSCPRIANTCAGSISQGCPNTSIKEIKLLSTALSKSGNNWKLLLGTSHFKKF